MEKQWGESLNSGQNMDVVFLNAKQLYLPAQDRHNIGLPTLCQRMPHGLLASTPPRLFKFIKCDWWESGKFSWLVYLL